MIDPSMVRRLQKDLQDRMEKARTELAGKRIEGRAGGGAVKVVANGNSELVEIVIAPEAVDPNDVAMLQDLVLAATNQALDAARKLNEETVSGITGGLHFPGLF